ncbi:MAG: maltose alpha-D-glucosyltransferase [Acidiferrobacterales bacterium]
MEQQRTAPETVLSDDPLWYKDAVIYELHVKAFFDSNGDGIGDFPGLTSKLDYLHDLGVNTLWLLPFYPSPLRDDGYDISDYHNVHPSYGTRRDFRNFVRAAHDRGLRIITELVINHSSDQHPWFQAARRSPPGSSKRNFYVWSDTDTKFAGTPIIFSDTEKSNWAWDEVAQAYYWHRFFSHQPDLNHNNPHVVKAMTRVMRFWLDHEVDGLRLDAVPYLCVREGTSNENLPETHAVIRQMRAEIDAHYRDRMLLAEANQWPEDVRDYFGNGDECHMAYHFPLMPRMYMAIAQEDRHPIVEILKQTPDIPENCQWAVFLRNHDELTLATVTSRERDYMYQMYAADPQARLNLGIRRRLAPLMDNDIDRIKLMNSLLLSMPGSPIIYYGDEIGMGDNIYLGDRNGVRTPMQWSPDRNAGFSHADPQRLYLPPIMDPVYGYEAVNVEAQSRDPSSLLNWMRRTLGVRRNYQAFGRGRFQFLRPGNRKILAYLREYGDEIILCVANLARSAQPVELDLAQYRGRVPVELMGRTAFPPVGGLPYLLTLPGHGFYWFRLVKDAQVPLWHDQRLAPEELPVVVLFDGLRSLLRDRVVPWRIRMAEKLRAQLETEVFPKFVAMQRWSGLKEHVPEHVQLADSAEWGGDPAKWLVALLRIGPPAGPPETYFAPFALIWDSGDDARDRSLSTATLARVRQQASTGVLADAFSDESFCRAMVAAAGRGEELPCAAGTIRFIPAARFEEIKGAAPLEELPVSAQGARGGHTVLRFGSRLLLKAYRRLRAGLHPEVEFSRFLGEVAHFSRSVPLAGYVEYVGGDGVTATLALIQGFVENQGDGWSYTLSYLERFLEQERTRGLSGAGSAETHGAYQALMGVLGRRTGELHLALAAYASDPAFAAEPLRRRDPADWVADARAEAVAALEALERQRTALGSEASAAAQAILDRRAELLQRIDSAADSPPNGVRTRIHGDFGLSKALLAQNDFFIIGFEGGAGRMRAEYRAKHSPLRDVASMLCSLSEARQEALLAATAGHPEDVRPLEPLLRAWALGARRAFLQAYTETTRDTGLLGDQRGMPQLLDMFELEQVLYGLRGALDQQSERSSFGLHGILELLGPPK